MRRVTVTLAALAICVLLPELARAGEGNKGKRKRTKGNREAFRKRILERFDKDGDGKLSAEERAAARKFREQAQARRGKGKGKKRGNDRRGAGNRRRRPNSGRPSGDRNKQQGVLELRRSIMKYFDRNRNGRLDAPEREQLMRLLNSGRPGAGDRGQGRRRFGGDTGGKKKRRRPAFNTEIPEGGDNPGLLDKAALLKKYDANGDGKIDVQERRRALKDRRKKKEA